MIVLFDGWDNICLHIFPYLHNLVHMVGIIKILINSSKKKKDSNQLDFFSLIALNPCFFFFFLYNDKALVSFYNIMRVYFLERVYDL